ncbi:borealin [Lacerta agilis]|uniref:borealin n=1 Tax=Lacerta agilis TaxID=80427 RepID=UPI001419F260|nr:borealin [Lacerta agilis]
MPAKKKNSRAANKNSVKSKKMDAFIKDFNWGVKLRIERIRMEEEVLLKEIDNMYNMEMVCLPVALRDINWLSFYGVAGCEQVLEKAVSVDLDMLEINKLASEAIQTPLKTVRKAKRARQAAETIGEESGPSSPLPAGKRSRQQSEDPAAAQPGSEALPKKEGKAKPSARKPRPPSARSTRFSKRGSKVKFVTPARQATQQGVVVAPTPKFDPSIFKTPGLRTPAAHERVFSVSANGSPLADSSDVILTIPSGRGESVCIRASELSKVDLRRLDSEVLGRVKKLSTQLAQLCGGSVQKK